MIQLLIRNSYDHQGPSFKVLWSIQFGQMCILCEPSLISYQILLIIVFNADSQGGVGRGRFEGDSKRIWRLCLYKESQDEYHSVEVSSDHQPHEPRGPPLILSWSNINSLFVPGELFLKNLHNKEESIMFLCHYEVCCV